MRQKERNRTGIRRRTTQGVVICKQAPCIINNMATFALSSSRLASALLRRRFSIISIRSASFIHARTVETQKSSLSPFPSGVHQRYNLPVFPGIEKCSSLMTMLRYGCRYYSSSELPTHSVLEMPALSPTMEKGNIASWKKNEGDKLEVGDVLCEIETDKATLDFETLEEGYLAKILVPTSSKDVPVGKPLAILVENKEDISKFTSFSPAEFSDGIKDAEENLKCISAIGKDDMQIPRFGPAVKRLLSEYDLDISSLKGTGPRGTILKGDVLAAINARNVSKRSLPILSAHSVSEVAKPQKKSHEVLPSQGNFSLLSSEVHEDIPNSQMRKIIAKRLCESKNGIPHLYLNANVTLDPLLQLKKELQDKHGLKVSVNDIVIKLVALALKAVPEANAFWSVEKEEATPCASVDISIAVATEKGLITPILKYADQKSLSEISAEVKILAEKARQGKLAPSEFQGGTFSISNLGMFPVDKFSAIINPPQAGILAVGRGNKVISWKEDTNGQGRPCTVNQMTLTLSADHRVFTYDVGEHFIRELSANFDDIKRLF